MVRASAKAIVLAWVLGAVLTGCASSTGVPGRSSEYVDPGRNERRIPVTPDMVSRVRAHYAETVRSGLLAPSTATVHLPETILASIDISTGTRRLWAVGAVDSQNVFGAMLRRRWTCCWGESRGAWASGINVEGVPLVVQGEYLGRLVKVMGDPEPHR